MRNDLQHALQQIAAKYGIFELSAHLEEQARLSNNPASALELYCRMRRISEDSYRAGWQVGLEYFLWKVVIEEPEEVEFGGSTLYESQLQKLRGLSTQAQGWWRYDDEVKDTVFVSLAQWKQKFSSYQDRTNSNSDLESTEQSALWAKLGFDNEDDLVDYFTLSSGYLEAHKFLLQLDEELSELLRQLGKKHRFDERNEDNTAKLQLWINEMAKILALAKERAINSA